MQFDLGEGRRIEAAIHALDRVPASAPAAMIFEVRRVIYDHRRMARPDGGRVR